MRAYQLLARLKNLILVGQEGGELQWLGTWGDWEKTEADELAYELDFERT